MEQEYLVVYDGKEHGPGTQEEVMKVIEVLGVVESLGNGRYHVYNKDGGPIMALVEVLPAKKRFPLSELIPAVQFECITVSTTNTDPGMQAEGYGI